MISQTVNDRYELLELIGEGGFGSVYKAKDLRLGHFVAVKLLSVADEEHEELIRARFVSEAQISAQLHHENILKTYNFGETDGERLFLVSELLTGHTLSQELKLGPLSVERTVCLMRQLFSGLYEAHEFGVIHRDLKPSNLFIHQRQQRNKRSAKEVLKVIDFGIAKTLGGSSKTMTGLVFGSPTYMSPEQVFTPKEITSKSDLYSAGIIFFQCLAGVLPFRQDPDLPMQIFIKHQSESPPTIQSLNPQFNDQTLQDLVNCLLAKDPNQRPLTVQTLEFLEDYLDGKTTDIISKVSVQQSTEFVKVPIIDPPPTPPSPPPLPPPLPLFASSTPSLSSPALSSQLSAQAVVEDDPTTVSPVPFHINTMSSFGETSASRTSLGRTRLNNSKHHTNIRRLWIIGGAVLSLLLLSVLKFQPDTKRGAPLSQPSLSQGIDTEQLSVQNGEMTEIKAVTSPIQTSAVVIKEKPPNSQRQPKDTRGDLEKSERVQKEQAHLEAKRKFRDSQARLKAERKRKDKQARLEAERKRKRTRRPLKKLRLMLPSKIRFKPGEIVPFRVSVSDNAGNTVKPSTYKLTATVSPKVGTVRKNKLHIDSSIKVTTLATLRVCAQERSQSHRVCSTENLAIYKPIY
jgi:serine/threonine protein kinase